MKRISWNTGRAYTESGQRIAACEIDNGVFFVDVDRMVSGFIPRCPLEIGLIMSNYDSRNYTYRPPSMDPNDPDRNVVFRALENSLTDTAEGVR